MSASCLTAAPRARIILSLRCTRLREPDSGKTLVFLASNTALPALTIAALYKSRLQIELFFKWIKQHLRIKRFPATSANAGKTQIWCAITTYVNDRLYIREGTIFSSQRPFRFTLGTRQRMKTHAIAQSSHKNFPTFGTLWDDRKEHTLRSLL